MNTKLLIGGIVVLAGVLVVFLWLRSSQEMPATVDAPTGVPPAPAAPPAQQSPTATQAQSASTPVADETDPSPAASPAAETSSQKTFNITGRNFAFSLQEIRVKKGDTVTINFSSVEGFHDFTIDEFNARTERVQAGQSSSVTFVADKAGTFEYYCSVGSHRALGMVGRLIVEE